MMEQLFGEPAFLFKEKINYKYPGTGKYNPHQDVHAYDKSKLAFQPYHLNCAVFIDESNEKNGCFEVVSGYEGKVFERNSDGSIISDISEQLPWVLMEANPGSVLIFNMWVPHKSERNKSDRPRRVLYLTFNGVSKEDLREAHLKDRALKKGQTREINPDLIIDQHNA
jgi:ectoine hydroxylase-related dioxygenase (phytanoyl-CoA dioxygenase family)